MIPLAIRNSSINVGSIVMTAVNRLRSMVESGLIQCSCGDKKVCSECLRPHLEQLISEDFSSIDPEAPDFEVVAHDVDRYVDKHLSSLVSEIKELSLLARKSIPLSIKALGGMVNHEPDEAGGSGPLQSSYLAADDGANIDLDLERSDLEERQVGVAGPVEKLLLRNGLIPLASANSYELGAGKYGKAFRASLGGKEVAVKVTKESGDFEMWGHIMEVAASAPSDVKKHFPQIYKLEHDSDSGMYLIAMELLAPLPPYIADRLFSNEVLNQGGTVREGPAGSLGFAERTELSLGAEIKKLFKDMDALWGLFDSIWFDSELGDVIRNGKGDSTAIKSMIFKVIVDYKPVDSSAPFITSFNEYFIRKANDILESIFGINHISVLSLFSADLINKIVLSAKASNFPHTGYSDEDHRLPYSQMPESKSLLSAVEYLEKAGIIWHDIHSGNLMTRPSTGDLVIIDVGLYQLEFDGDHE